MYPETGEVKRSVRFLNCELGPTELTCTPFGTQRYPHNRSAFYNAQTPHFLYILDYILLTFITVLGPFRPMFCRYKHMGIALYPLICDDSSARKLKRSRCNNRIRATSLLYPRVTSGWYHFIPLRLRFILLSPSIISNSTPSLMPVPILGEK